MPRRPRKRLPSKRIRRYRAKHEARIASAAATAPSTPARKVAEPIASPATPMPTTKSPTGTMRLRRKPHVDLNDPTGETTAASAAAPQPPQRMWCKECQKVFDAGDRKHWRHIVTDVLPGAIRTGSVRSDDDSVETRDMPRYRTDIEGLDRVLGGGLVGDSVVLLSGAPGCGKSRLLGWTCKRLAEKGALVLYVAAEENVGQVKLRLKDGGMFHANVRLMHTGSMEDVEREIARIHPHVVVYDSIQSLATMHEPGAKVGGVIMVQAVAKRIVHLCKSVPKYRTIAIVVCHINKDGVAAGPKDLEHDVDVILHFMPNEQFQRVLTVQKDRFGPSGCRAVFEFAGATMREVKNVSAAILPATGGGVGSVLVPAMVDGHCVVLPVDASISDPREGEEHRALPPYASGVSDGQLRGALDLLADHMNLVTKNRSVRLKVRRVGAEADLKDGATDAALVVALASAFDRLAMPPHTAIVGELSPSGRVETDPLIEKRLHAAKEAGVRTVIGPMLAPTVAGIEYRAIADITGLLAWMRSVGVSTRRRYPQNGGDDVSEGSATANVPREEDTAQAAPESTPRVLPSSENVPPRPPSRPRSRIRKP